jgi:hypothetical protein
VGEAWGRQARNVASLWSLVDRLPGSNTFGGFLAAIGEDRIRPFAPDGPKPIAFATRHPCAEYAQPHRSGQPATRWRWISPTRLPSPIGLCASRESGRPKENPMRRLASHFTGSSDQKCRQGSPPAGAIARVRTRRDRKAHTRDDEKSRLPATAKVTGSAVISPAFVLALDHSMSGAHIRLK